MQLKVGYRERKTGLDHLLRNHLLLGLIQVRMSRTLQEYLTNSVLNASYFFPGAHLLFMS